MGQFVSAMDTLARMDVRAHRLFVSVPISRSSVASQWCIAHCRGMYFFDNHAATFSMHFYFADPRDASYVKTAFG